MTKQDLETREARADQYKRESGKESHSSDCATSRAPAFEPGPCDCDAPRPRTPEMDALLNHIHTSGLFTAEAALNQARCEGPKNREAGDLYSVLMCARMALVSIVVSGDEDKAEDAIAKIDQYMADAEKRSAKNPPPASESA